MKVTPGRPASSMELDTMPLRSGRRPVTSVQWLGKVLDGKDGRIAALMPLAASASRVGVTPRVR
ncbi:hypothetical protein D9M73_130980 [compost metagenome]